MTAARSRSPMSPRQWLLGAALVAALGATWWASQSGDDELVQPVAGSKRRAAAPAARAAREAPAEAAAAPTDWQAVQRAAWAAVPDSQFAAWSPPPPPPAPRVVKAPPVAPPAPVAPPFPYQIIGSLRDQGGQTQAFLSGPSRSLNARVGDVIDGQWRVDQVSASGLALTWLPAQLKQQIALRPIP
ncbi:hypothetical protein BH11PSE10_BH11PSE10_07440 [soil metagenome]